MNAQQRFRQAEVAAWVGIVGNMMLSVLKGVIGSISGSRALMADSVHSAADVVGSLAVLIGLRVAKKPADMDHPYGHGKAEIIAAGLVALFLFAAGAEVAYTSVRALFGAIEPPRIEAAIAAVIAIVVKEAMFRYKFNLGRKLDSPALIANAYEHRSDVFSSLAALAGILASVAGGKFHIHWLEYTDPLAGVFVAVLVLKMGYDLARDASQTLMDQAIDEHLLTDISALAGTVKGVERVDEIRGREHGHYVVLDVKMSVSPDITVREGHEIAKRLKQSVLDDFPKVRDVLVHVNPFDESEVDD